MNYSYVMGIEDVTDLSDNHFIIEKINKSFGVAFGDDQINTFEEFIIRNLPNGYWNEYLGDRKVFIFKFENGDVNRYVLDDSNENEILELCREFAEYNFESIDRMLRDNAFYNKKYFGG